MTLAMMATARAPPIFSAGTRPNPSRHRATSVFSSSSRHTPPPSSAHPYTSFSLVDRHSHPHAISGAGSLDFTTGGGGTPGGGSRGGGGGGGDDDDNINNNNNEEFSSKALGPLALFKLGWRRRVRADPQFAFKVFSEVVIGVAACVLGDMASRPNFGLNELDFVFSTVVVGSILNFTLMYMLAPTATAHQLPLLFAACPPGHMFEPGPYSLLDRTGTFIYKGIVFSAVGFLAGLAGTALSNALLAVRKKVDSRFESQNKAPPTVLNALTWAGHMGLSSNARYQALNGLEFALAGTLHPSAFKAAVFVLRGVNNVCGGITFVMLARKTGSQSAPDVEVREAKESLVLADKTV